MPVGRNGVFEASSLLTLALIALCWAHAIFLGPLLIYPDLVLTYPFPGGDGWDWINNGLFLAGEDVRSTQRPPLLPLLLAGLDRLPGPESMRFFPVLHQLVVQGGILALFLAARRRALPPAAFAAAGTLLFGAAFQLQGLTVMADHLAGLLLFGAAVAWMRAVEQPAEQSGLRTALSLLAGLLGGLSAVTQQAALLLPMAIALAALLAPPVTSDGRRRWWAILRGPLVFGAFPFIAIPAAWFLWKRWTWGAFTDVGTRHWGLLAPHLDGVGFYAEAVMQYFGIPALLVAALGMGQMVKRRTPGDVFVLSLLATLTGFFVFLYDWPAERFVLYGYLLLGIPLAEGFARLRGFHRAVPWVAAVLAVLWIAVPGMPRGVAAGAEQSPYLRVLEARAERKTDSGATEIPDPSRFAAIDSVVFLHGDGPDGEMPSVKDRYRTQYRLGGAVRKRVKWVPAMLYPESWPGWRGLRWRVAFDEYEVFELRLPSFERSHLVAAARGGEVAAKLHRRAGTRPEALDPGAPRRPLPVEERVPPGWETALATARRLDGLTGRDPAFLTVLADRDATRDDAWLRLLPFVAHTTSLFILDGERAADVRAQMEAQEARTTGEIMTKGSASLTVRRAKVGGWRTLVVE